MLLFRNLLFLVFLTGMVFSASAIQTYPTQTAENPPAKEYLNLMEWLTLQSNSYSGILNERQTWIVSYDEFQIKEEYYWDNQLTVVIEFDIRNIEKVRSELRFFHSISLYPKEGDATHFKVTRYDEGIGTEVEAEYYNLLIDPTIKKEVYQKMQKALDLCKDKS